jgi:hypothetical protein
VRPENASRLHVRNRKETACVGDLTAGHSYHSNLESPTALLFRSEPSTLSRISPTSSVSHSLTHTRAPRCCKNHGSRQENPESSSLTTGESRRAVGFSRTAASYSYTLHDGSSFLDSLSFSITRSRSRRHITDGGYINYNPFC